VPRLVGAEVWIRNDRNGGADAGWGGGRRYQTAC